jgi:hypothetical protein
MAKRCGFGPRSSVSRLAGSHFSAMRRSSIRVAVLLAALGFCRGATGGAAPAGGSACAGVGFPGDENIFRLLHSGEAVGTESFGIQIESAESVENHASQIGTEAGTSIQAEGTATISGRAFETRQTLRIDTESFALQDYRLLLTTGTETESIRATVMSDSVVIRITSSGVLFRRALPRGNGDLFVLDNLLVNHLAILGCRITRDGFRAETLRVVVPQVGEILDAAVLPHTPSLDGSRKVDIRVATTIETLEFMPDGRLGMVQVPSQAISYVRMISAAEAAPAAPHRSREPVAGTSPGRPLFMEEPVHFVSNRTNLDGILTLPTGGQPIPYASILLIAGAGPQDRDGTIGSRHPLRDLARGLAVNGIASLRYDNRWLVAPGSINPRTATIDAEVIDDQISALAYMRSRSEIDGSRISIAGLGIGAVYGAMAAARDGPVAGLIVLGQVPEAVAPEQLRHLDSFPGQSLRVAGAPIMQGIIDPEVIDRVSEYGDSVRTRKPVGKR